MSIGLLLAGAPNLRFEAHVPGKGWVRFYQFQPEFQGTLELDGPHNVHLWQRHDFDCVAGPMAAAAKFIVQGKFIILREGGPVIGQSAAIDREGANTTDIGDIACTRCFRVADGRNLWNAPLSLVGTAVAGGPGGAYWSILPHPSVRRPYFVVLRVDAGTGKVKERWRLPYRVKEPVLWSLANFEHRYRVHLRKNGYEIVGLPDSRGDPRVDPLGQPKASRLSAVRRSSRGTVLHPLQKETAPDPGGEK
ncbi:MAG TPA: hypothetical protein VG944_13285 [Fimbriimonas sp.]|nr:hypothetical protein [Fimbriimonas sp.]